MFADDNRAFLAGQLDDPDYAMAARGGDELLAGLGVSFRSLPYYFRIDAQTHAALLQATQVLVSAQEKLLRHLVATRSSAELCAMFEVPAGMAAHIDWADVAARPHMLRADIIPTADGYHFCGLNHFSGVGAGEGYHSARAFAELLDRSVAGVSPFRELAHLYATECRRRGLTRIVILDTTMHRAQGFGEQIMLQRYLRLMAPDVEIRYHDEQTYPVGWLAPGEARRTLVHRLVTYDDTPDEGAFLASLRDGGATISGMFEAELKTHRRWLSLLCDPCYRHLLDDEECATIERYVPRTYDVHPDTVDTAVADKDRLVFKRGHDYGGKGILIGEEYPPEQLRALLAVNGSAWVAQRRVDTSSLELPVTSGRTEPFYFALGVFVYGDNASGLLVRAAACSCVVNLSQGGDVSWAFVD